FMGRRPEFVANYVVSSDPEVAHKAVMALGTTENEYALDALRLVVRDGPDGLARNSAIAQLGASGNPETLHFLRMEMRETDVP
ncbi:HEAT repeat domain-containing protein, partial [Klebsiella pneumoniae]|uniref:HEAT repeat domain-containing protein n=1 Tax=Klebsiella pneumoniae TaxID=573 RepID=UPI003851F52C